MQNRQLDKLMSILDAGHTEEERGYSGWVDTWIRDVDTGRGYGTWIRVGKLGNNLALPISRVASMLEEWQRAQAK